MTRNKDDMDVLDDLSPAASSVKKGRAKSSQSSRKSAEMITTDPYWSPSPYSAFKLLISARFAAALWSTISDCDETFNYWEPVI